jgi:hypothetical protein
MTAAGIRPGLAVVLVGHNPAHACRDCFHRADA